VSVGWGTVGNVWICGLYNSSVFGCSSVFSTIITYGIVCKSSSVFSNIITYGIVCKCSSVFSNIITYGIVCKCSLVFSNSITYGIVCKCSSVFSNIITYGIVCKCNIIYQQYLFCRIIVFWCELDLLICKFSEGVVLWVSSLSTIVLKYRCLQL
jgi:hypothetical protein